jgi:tRNA-dihydrouridine synthase
MHGQILAPLTRGGNLPFRRLCADFGAEATMSEMSFARHLLRGAPQEKALLKRAPNEACFGTRSLLEEVCLVSFPPACARTPPLVACGRGMAQRMHCTASL